MGSKDMLVIDGLLCFQYIVSGAFGITAGKHKAHYTVSAALDKFPNLI